MKVHLKLCACLSGIVEAERVFDHLVVSELHDVVRVEVL